MLVRLKMQKPQVGQVPAGGNLPLAAERASRRSEPDAQARVDPMQIVTIPRIGSFSGEFAR